METNRQENWRKTKEKMGWRYWRRHPGVRNKRVEKAEWGKDGMEENHWEG